MLQQPKVCIVRSRLFSKKPTMSGVKFPMSGITSGINFKASRRSIFKNGQTEVKCFAHIKCCRKEAKQYQVRGQTRVGWGQ